MEKHGGYRRCLWRFTAFCRLPIARLTNVKRRLAEVTRLIGQGMRMRDIAMIARTSSQYDGVIDAVLTKHGITAFMSSKDELAEKPLPGVSAFCG